jgi:thiamine transport system permease protein
MERLVVKKKFHETLQEYNFPEFFWTVLIVAFFLLPFLIMLLHFSEINWAYLDKTFLKTVVNTTLQSVTSAFFSVVLGWIGAIGISGISSNKKRSLFELIFIIPTVLPAFYIILSVMRVNSLLELSATGLPAIVVAHAFSYAGLIAVFLGRVLRLRLSSYSALCAIDGMKLSRFLITSWPLYKKEVGHFALTVFFACLASFSIPLIFGGGTRYSLEVLMYEHAVVNGQWPALWSVALIQFAVLYVFTSMVQKRMGNDFDFRAATTEETLHIPGTRIFAAIFLLFSLGIIFLGLQKTFSAHLDFLFHFRLIATDIFRAVIGSSVVLIFNFVLTELVLMFMVLYYPAKNLRQFFVRFSGVSVALTGAAALVLTDSSQSTEKYTLVVVSLGLFIFTFPAIYRLAFENIFNQMKGAVEQARVLGASPWQIYVHIFTPVFRAQGAVRWTLFSLWICGDFAFTSMVAGRPITLGALAYQYLGGYYVEASEIIMLMILFLSLFFGFLYFITFGLDRWLQKRWSARYVHTE